MSPGPFRREQVRGRWQPLSATTRRVLGLAALCLWLSGGRAQAQYQVRKFVEDYQNTLKMTA